METTKVNIRVKDYIKDVDEKAERRFFHQPLKFAEIEENGVKKQDDNVIEGYAAVFNKDSEDFGGWNERISPGAFRGVLQDDAVALFNHSMNLVLGRNGVNVTITEDDNGLLTRIKVPDTSLGRDIKELVRSGIISKMSFAFTVAEERYVKGKDGANDMRIIDKMQRLYDVSPVTYPAYPDTSIAARGFKKMNATEEIRKALTEQQTRIIYRTLKHKFNLNTKF